MAQENLEHAESLWKAENVKHAGVVGGGTMGNGIAHVFAQAGIDVTLVDVDEEVLARALQTIETRPPGPDEPYEPRGPWQGFSRIEPEEEPETCVSVEQLASLAERIGDIPAEFNKSIGDWVFGCDICQEVCPFNHSPPQTTEPQFAVRSPGPHLPLRDILNWQVTDYRRTLKGSAMKRARLEKLQRNARIALSNTEDGP